MIVLYLALGTFGCLFALWLLWIVVAGLSRASQERRLSPLITHVGVAVAAFGLAYDALCNVLICSFIFFDLPREATLSQRLRRLVTSTGWRSRLAIWFAVNLINPFSADRNDPHIHIQKGS